MYKNDQRLGVMATGLSGEYSWAVAFQHRRASQENGGREERQLRSLILSNTLNTPVGWATPEIARRALHVLPNLQSSLLPRGAF